MHACIFLTRAKSVVVFAVCFWDFFLHIWFFEVEYFCTTLFFSICELLFILILFALRNNVWISIFLKLTWPITASRSLCSHDWKVLHFRILLHMYMRCSCVWEYSFWFLFAFDLCSFSQNKWRNFTDTAYHSFKVKTSPHSRIAWRNGSPTQQRGLQDSLLHGTTIKHSIYTSFAFWRSKVAKCLLLPWDHISYCIECR